MRWPSPEIQHQRQRIRGWCGSRTWQDEGPSRSARAQERTPTAGHSGITRPTLEVPGRAGQFTPLTVFPSLAIVRKMTVMTSNADKKSADNDPYEGLDEITSDLAFPEHATGWPDTGCRENLPDAPRHTRQGAGPNQGAREG